MDLRDEYMDKCGGSEIAAAVLWAMDLMRGDPTTHKAGYTAANAALAAEEMLGVPAEDVLALVHLHTLSNLFTRQEGGLR